MLSFFLAFRGELAALTAAFFWAVATAVYGRVGQQVGPLLINLIKNSLAIAGLALTLWLQNPAALTLSLQPVLLLAASGVIGIGIGDTAYLAALNCLGARRTLLLEALAPPLTALIALVVLQEVLSLTAWLGIGLTLAGVIGVITERTSAATSVSGQLQRGLLLGLLAELSQASGAVMSRLALTTMEISPLWSTLVRLLAGVGFLSLVMVGQHLRRSPRDRPDLPPPRLTLKFFGIIAGVSFFSTYLGIWLQQIALKFAPAGIAQALSSTSPLFILPIAAGLGEKISLRAIAGVIIALIGVRLLFL